MKISRDKSFILAILIGSSALSPASLLYGASVSQNTPANCNQTELTLALTAGAGVTVYGALKLREEYIRHGYIQTVYYLKHILMPDDKFEQKMLKYALSGLKYEESQQLKMLYVAQVKNANGRIIFTNYVNELITRYKKLASGAEFENNSAKTGWVSTFEAYAAQPVKDVCNGYKKNDYTQTAKGALTLGSCGLALAGMCYVDAVSILLNVFGLLKNKEPYSGGSNSSNNDPRDAQVDIGFDEAIAKSLQYQELEEIDQKNLNRAITCSLDDQKGLPKNPPVSNGPSDQGAASGNNDKEASGPGSAKAIALKATDDIANDISRKHRQQKNRAKKNRNAARKKNKTNEKNNTKLMSDPYAPRRGNKARKGKSAINSGARSGFESFNENGNRKVGRNPFELLASASDSDDKADKKMALCAIARM